MNPHDSQTSFSQLNKPLLIKWLVLLFVVLVLVIIYFYSRKEKAIEEDTVPPLNPVAAVPENELEKEKEQIKEVVPGKTFYISLDGNDKNSGLESNQSMKTIQKAINAAEPGDTINIADGEYLQDIVSKRNGTNEKRITLQGSDKAVIKGGGNNRIIEINHDFITLRGFTVDGHFDASKKKEKGFRDKLIFVQSNEPKKGVSHLLIDNMTIQNAGGECIRLKYLAEKNEISNNMIRNCGTYDFVFDKGGKNGEGIYIGTAPEQLKSNPTKDIDVSKNNWIHHNTIDTAGNECVDMKEGSMQNIVEYNSCTGQKDEDSGGIGSRGNENVIRYNQIFNNKGAGIRLGGDKKNYGINNFIYENTIRDNDSGGIKIQRKPQGKICKNIFTNNKGGEFVGKYEDDFKNESNC